MRNKNLEAIAVIMLSISLHGSTTDSLVTREYKLGQSMPQPVGNVVSTQQWRKLTGKGFRNGAIVAYVQTGEVRNYDLNRDRQPDYSASFYNCGGVEKPFAFYFPKGIKHPDRLVVADMSGIIKEISLDFDNRSPEQDAPICPGLGSVVSTQF